MAQVRKIIEIDEEKCTGCGQCVIDCAEGALEIIDGKAKMIGDIYCDGLGACIGGCPEDALTIIEREAEEFSEEAVEELLASKEKGAEPAPLACGCPGSAAQALSPFPSASAADAEAGPQASSLGHWPVKLQLLGPGAPFLMGADLVLLADCFAAAYPDLHARLLPGKAVAMGCPKLDDVQAHIDRLAEILKHSQIKSLTVAHMQVPCCHGFIFAAKKALEKAGVDIPAERIEISPGGEILAREEIKAG